MAFLKLENVWQIIRNNNYESLVEVQHDMLCLLCKKLLVNARNAPCGCRFCFSCISSFLDCENKICPGNTEFCKLELLDMNINIAIDNPINAKISKIKVKCPEISCEFVDELIKMEDHLRMCKYRSAACPYSNIGCDKCNISQNKVADHLQSEILTHTKLLMDVIGNFNNEMEMMKANNNRLSAEINELKLDGERRREEIAELQRNCDEKSTKIDQLNADIICLNGENVAMRENMDKLISSGERNLVEIGDLQRKCANQAEEIELLNEDIPALRNVDRSMSDRLDGLQLNVEGNQVAMRACENNLQQQIAQCATNFQQAESKFHNSNQIRENKQKELIDKIGQMKKKQNEIDKSMDNVDMKLLETAANQNQLNYGEFVWKLDKFTDKMADAKNGINTDIYSESFLTHKNGYEMFLLVDPDGFGVGERTHLSVSFCLMKGKFDDILEWPFMHSVTVALINQRTKLPHVSWTAKYADNPNDEAFIQPTDENNGFGFPQFVSHEELSSNPDLMRNNQIFIKCSVDIDS